MCPGFSKTSKERRERLATLPPEECEKDRRLGIMHELYAAGFSRPLAYTLNRICIQRLGPLEDSLEYLQERDVTLKDLSHIHKSSVAKLQRYLLKHYGFELP